MTTTASDRKAVIRKLRTVAKRHDRASAALAAAERERTEVYLEARAVEPPVTFREIADIFGVTEAAVMQKLKREEVSVASAKGKP